MQQKPFDIANASDLEIEAAIDSANQQGFSVNLNIPATKDNILRILDSLNCRRCGICCSTGTCPGVKKNGIPLREEEIVEIASYLKKRARKVKRLCFSNDLGGFSLPYPCPFYLSSPSPKCSIYSARPITYRVFPLYSITQIYDDVAVPPMITIDPGCPSARNFILNHFRSIREYLSSREKEK